MIKPQISNNVYNSKSEVKHETSQDVEDNSGQTSVSENDYSESDENSEETYTDNQIAEQSQNNDNFEEVAANYAIAIVKSDYSNINEYLPYNANAMIGYADYDPYEHSLEVTAEVIQAFDISEEQIGQLLDNICQEWLSYNLYMEDYIDGNKIEKGYFVNVRMSVYEPGDDEDWGSATFTYPVVKYNGNWKVLTDFITDRDEMYKVW